MPDMDGFSVLKKIRRTSRVPVLMLTARGEAEDRIEGLEVGADDYLAKPFLPKELLLRVGAILNRAYPRQNEMVELAGATVDMDNAEVWKNGEKQALTAKEMQLFEKLYGLLIAGLVGAPYYLNRLLFILMDVLHLDSLASLVLHGLLIGGYLFWLFFAGIRMALHKPLFYERWSRTKLVSTINRT